MRRAIAGVCGLFLAATAAGAEDIRITCKISPIKSSYVQPTEIVLYLDADRTRVDVEDSLMRQFWSSAMRGTIETRNAARTTYVWTVSGLERDPKLFYLGSAPNKVTQRLTIRSGGRGDLVTIASGQATHQAYEYRANASCLEGK